MICKNCGAQFDTSSPDASGIVTCPECGKKYQKKTSPAAAPAAAATAAKPAGDFVQKVKDGFDKFTKMKIGGSFPLWGAVAGGVVALILIIVLLSAIFGGGPAGSPKAMVKLAEKALNGNPKAAWNLMSPEDKEEYKNYGEFAKEFKEFIKEMKEYGGNYKYTLTYKDYEKHNTYKRSEYDDHRTEDGEVEFKVKLKYKGDTDEWTEDFDYIKINGKYYLRSIGELFY